MKSQTAKYGKIDARPTKEFFVGMLTRDISLEDAILDLLDNCVDGVLRNVGESKVDRPYEGYWAKITFDSNKFKIEDNCGGIPWSEHMRAFRQGRPLRVNDGLATVGTYGIGMKRAIYKMGRACTIKTQSGKDAYGVAINPEWFEEENNWDLEANKIDKLREEGTQIEITQLVPSIAEWLALPKFKDDIGKKIESHYAVILHKGFKVLVNGTEINPLPISFRFEKSETANGTIRPYIFEAKIDGVEVFLSVGLREPIPGIEEVQDEQRENRYSTNYAGWTVICNDRVVLYCNKDEQTGWGEATVPHYHTQFIAISGVVEFRSTDARKLPTTTTKRGLDQSSRLYAQVKNRMREGTKLFTSYTNNWKYFEPQAKAQVHDVPTLTFNEVKTAAKRLGMTPVKSGLAGNQYKPNLPKPPADDDAETRIAFRVDTRDFETVSAYVLPESTETGRELASSVGKECFERVLDLAKKPKRKT